MTADREPSWQSLALLAVVVAGVMFVFPLFCPLPLLDPDEGLHASIAQEMKERGNWLTPSFLGRPFFDKPILYFWAQVFSLRMFGDCEAAVRLPGLMFGLLGALTTGLLAWRLFGRTVGLIAASLYATTILPTAMAQAAAHDVALIPWINLAILLLLESERPGNRARQSLRIGESINVVRNCHPERSEGSAWGRIRSFAALRMTVIPSPILCLVGAGIFVGLSILTKGLLGAAAVGLAYGGYCLIRVFRTDGGGLGGTNAWNRLTRLAIRGAVVLVVALAVAAPWYLAVEAEHPGFLRYFFVDRHVKGFATNTQPHGSQAWWYYLPILAGGGLPWIGYLGLARNKLLRDGETQSPTALLWFWLIAWTLFVTAAGSKLATYLWPAFPPIAILAAVAWVRLIAGLLGDDARRSFTRTFVGSSLSGPIVLPVVALVVERFYHVNFAWPVWLGVAVAAAAAPLPVVPWLAGRRSAALASAVLSVAAQFVVAMTLVAPPVAEQFTARDLAEHFNRQGRLPARLFVAEERIGSLVFYLDPRLRAGLAEGQFQALNVDSTTWPSPGDTVAVPKWEIERTGEYLDLNGVHYEQAKRYRLYRNVRLRGDLGGRDLE